MYVDEILVESKHRFHGLPNKPFMKVASAVPAPIKNGIS
jgi:hypothetical protein